jgi:hypothetical protein
MKTRRTFLRFALAALILLPACKQEDSSVPDSDGLLGSGLFFPYPSIHLMEEAPGTATGWKVAIPEGLLPIAENGTPMPLDRFNRLDGFSPATPCLVYMEGLDVDPATLPGPSRIEESVREDSTVQIIDLGTGERLPLFAETDAHRSAVDQGKRTLIIRPQKLMAWKTRYAVVVTKGIRDFSGQPLPVPPAFEALVRGRNIPPSLQGSAAHYEGLFEALEGFGIRMDDAWLAWDFWTGSKEVIHGPLDHIMEETERDIPADPEFMPDYEILPSRTLDSDLDPDVDPLIWRHMELTFSMKTFVNAEGVFEFGEDGLPMEQGDDDFILIVHIPPSVHDAPAGSVPVIVFGHGMLGAPHDYLVREGDPLHVLHASDRFGAIYAAAEFRGLSMRDQLDAVTAATDFGKFHYVTEDLTMGIANFAAVARMFRTKFIEDPFFLASDGSGSLVDTSRIHYVGISLGGHEGGVVTAVSDIFQYAVLQVGGCPWTLMLERSSNWNKYDIIITTWVRDPVDRQMLYAVSQMLWDPVDPATHVEALRGKSILLQESIGDAQVPNLSTEFWARSIGLPLVQPSTTHPPFIEEVEAPVGPGGSALFQYDATVFESCGPVSGELNLPAEDNCAHHIVSECEAQQEQIEAFLAEGSEGTIIQPPSCGTQPCHPEP